MTLLAAGTWKPFVVHPAGRGYRGAVARFDGQRWTDYDYCPHRHRSRRAALACACTAANNEMRKEKRARETSR